MVRKFDDLELYFQDKKQLCTSSSIWDCTVFFVLDISSDKTSITKTWIKISNKSPKLFTITIFFLRSYIVNVWSKNNQQEFWKSDDIFNLSVFAHPNYVVVSVNIIGFTGMVLISVIDFCREKRNFGENRQPFVCWYLYTDDSQIKKK